LKNLGLFVDMYVALSYLCHINVSTIKRICLFEWLSRKLGCVVDTRNTFLIIMLVWKHWFRV